MKTPLTTLLFVLIATSVSGGWIAELLSFERPVYTTDRMAVRDANKKAVKDELHAQDLDLHQIFQLFNFKVEQNRDTILFPSNTVPVNSLEYGPQPTPTP